MDQTHCLVRSSECLNHPAMGDCWKLMTFINTCNKNYPENLKKKVLGHGMGGQEAHHKT